MELCLPLIARASLFLMVLYNYWSKTKKRIFCSLWTHQATKTERRRVYQIIIDGLNRDDCCTQTEIKKHKWIVVKHFGDAELKAWLSGSRRSFSCILFTIFPWPAGVSTSLSLFHAIPSLQSMFSFSYTAVLFVSAVKITMCVFELVTIPLRIVAPFGVICFSFSQFFFTINSSRPIKTCYTVHFKVF